MKPNDAITALKKLVSPASYDAGAESRQYQLDKDAVDTAIHALKGEVLKELAAEMSPIIDRCNVCNAMGEAWYYNRKMERIPLCPDCKEQKALDEIKKQIKELDYENE